MVPAAAAILTGIIVLLAAILLAVATRSIGGARRRRREAAPSLEACEDAADLGSEIGRRIRGLTEAHASGGLLAALVAGFAIGMSPRLRAFLKSILKS